MLWKLDLTLIPWVCNYPTPHFPYPLISTFGRFPFPIPETPPRKLTNLKLCILYLLAFLDRTNIGNAKIDGLQKSLNNLSTGKYNAALSIFFVSYSVFEPLTNILLKRLRPAIFIPIIM